MVSLRHRSLELARCDEGAVKVNHTLKTTKSNFHLELLQKTEKI